MTDIVSPETRSRMMSGIRSKNTHPEIIVRKWLHSQGYRFRLHRKDLPGKPDIILSKYHTVIFVHGCFWHQHPQCRYAVVPASRTTWWLEKFRQNRERDTLAARQLKEMGWHVITIWECEVKNGNFIDILKKFFERRHEDQTQIKQRNALC